MEHGETSLTLEGGRLTARPGPDLYLYTFDTPGGPLPDPGRRGIFVHGDHNFPACLADRRGPSLTISLVADKPLGVRLSGFFRPERLAPIPEAAAVEASPPGLALFLDPSEGWIMSLAEVASQKTPLFDPAHWPRASRDDLPGRLCPVGPTFIWRQVPDRDSATAARLIAHFREREGRVLVLGQTYADLEPLAKIPGALFTGPASPGTPLHPISIHTKIAEALEARELELRRLRDHLNQLQSEEAGCKARLANWDDLDDLTRRFKEFGQEAARRSRKWEEVRKTVAAARTSWEEASVTAEKSGRGLLGWHKNPDGLARRQEERHRRSLDTAEAAMVTVRLEEERTLAEARHLESRLYQMRRDSEEWTARDRLQEEAARVRREQERTAALMAAADRRPGPGEFIAAAPLVLAPIEAPPRAAWPGPAFTDIVALVSGPPDHAGRQNLAALALQARRHLVVLGDFTLWPVWSGRAPLCPGLGSPAWLNFIVAEEADEMKTFLAEGGVFAAGGRLPANGPTLDRLELSQTVPLSPADLPNAKDGDAPRPSWFRDEVGFGCGVGLRALGDLGPANPVSALMTARAALNFAARLDEPGPAALILTASAAQARLVRCFLTDLGAPPGRVFSGEPQDFAYWDPVPLVIVEPAFEAPHLGHPWAWPSFGRQKLTWAWPLARDHIWLAGRDGWMRHLPEASPLAALWHLSATRATRAGALDPLPREGGDRGTMVSAEYLERTAQTSEAGAESGPGPSALVPREGGGSSGLAVRESGDRGTMVSAEYLGQTAQTSEAGAESGPGLPALAGALSFWEALDRAKKDVWAVLPTFEPFWWRPLEEHFLAAARRRVGMTILTAPPTRDGNWDYADTAIKTLAAYGCPVHLATGFPGFLAVVDGRHVSWGHFVAGPDGLPLWNGLQSILAPTAGPEIGEILQVKLINEKMGRQGGGLKTCRYCGWPLVLINQEHSSLGAGDEQPLKLSCLADCQGRKGARRLDERDPFTAPPRCALEPGTLYRRLWRGRQETWVCPTHPDGPKCPSFRVIPGDPPDARESLKPLKGQRSWTF